MKARIIQEPRCVLLWRFDEKSAGYDALAHAARAYKLKIRCIGDGDLAAKVGDLCRGLPSPAFAPLIKVSDRPAMIVSGLRHDTGELGHFLDLVKAGGACRATPPARKNGTPKPMPCTTIWSITTSCLTFTTTTTAW